MRKNNQTGRSMVEMLGVLAIIGVLSVGAIAGYQKAMMKYKTNKLITQISTIITNIRTLYASADNFAGLTNMKKNPIIVPNELIKQDKERPIHAFNAEINFYETLYNAEDTDSNKGFDVVIDFSFPEQVCVELLSYEWNKLGISFIMSDTVIASGHIIARTPLSVKTAKDFCSIVNPEGGSIYFEYMDRDFWEEYKKDFGYTDE